MTAIHKPTDQLPHVLIIGVGNEFRRDDGVGLVIAQALKQKPLPQVKVLESTGDGADLIDTWQDHERVILIDAVDSGATPGTLYQFNLQDRSLPIDFLSHSTHTFGVAEAIELARTLNRLPAHCLFFGIEGADFTLGTGLSPSMEGAVSRVVDNICTVLEHRCVLRIA